MVFINGYLLNVSFNTRISTFWTYINVPRITGELV